MRVAVLGTGTMGGPMARNLAPRAFGEVAVWNRTRERAEPLAQDGCRVADSAADAVATADAVIVMLADGDAVLAVADEALGAMREGAILLQMSTIGLDATDRVAQAAADRGFTFVDAPVLGSRPQAEEGRLFVLASGPDEALDRLDTVFDAVASRVRRFGDAGGGQRMKLALNAWIVALTESLAETLVLAESLGIDAAKFLETIRGGPIDSGYAQLKGGAMAERSFEPANFTLELARKDAGLALDAAARADLELPVLQAVAQQMNRAIEAGHGEKDMAATFLASWREP